PPVLAPIGDQNVDEETELMFTASATDPDLPPNTLTFSLDPGAPAGASIDGRTGVFSWTPTEAQGPGTYQETIRVTDDGTPPLSAAETIRIRVNEVNKKPVLAPIPDVAVDEETPLMSPVIAADPDVPANTLIYTLGGAPAGAAIDPSTGFFTWTPSEA